MLKIILCILRSVRNGDSDWDLVKDHLLLKEKKMSHLFKRICQWTQGLLNTSQDDIPAFFSGMSDIHYGNDILKHIAVVNVKKSGGKPILIWTIIIFNFCTHNYIE